MPALSAAADRVAAAQQRELALYLRRHVAPFSPLHGAELRAGSGSPDIQRVPPRRLADIERPSDLVLRPTVERISSSGLPDLRARLLWARVTRRLGSFNSAVLEPVYKPVHWQLAAGVPLGYSAEDVERLAEIGRATIEHAGVGPYDVIVGLAPPGPELAFWQLTLGARRGGVPSVFLGPEAAATAAMFEPTVLAGPAAAVEAALAGGAAVHTVLLTDPPGPGLAQRLAAGAPGAAVVPVWAPPGVRAAWAGCRNGSGLHIWPATEHLDVTGGELEWTPIGWKGSVLLRLLTGVAGTIDRDRCPACGRTAPRLHLDLPPVATPAPTAGARRRRSRSTR